VLSLSNRFVILLMLHIMSDCSVSIPLTLTLTSPCFTVTSDRHSHPHIFFQLYSSNSHSDLPALLSRQIDTQAQGQLEVKIVSPKLDGEGTLDLPLTQASSSACVNIVIACPACFYLVLSYIFRGKGRWTCLSRRQARTFVSILLHK
jgi:hypothetical protein